MKQSKKKQQLLLRLLHKESLEHFRRKFLAKTSKIRCSCENKWFRFPKGLFVIIERTLELSLASFYPQHY